MPQPAKNPEPDRPARPAIGMVGLGDMGAAIATSILRNGYELYGCDVRPQAVAALAARGAHAATLEELADKSDIAILVVMDDKQVQTVVDILLRHPGRLHTIIVSSTVLPSTVIALAKDAAARGLALIDAPVSGGAEKASRGLITVLVGGETASVQRCWPVFEAFGKSLFHIGPAGAGSAGKLVNNMLSMGGNALNLEAMQLAGAYGISEDAVTTFMAVSTGDSRGLRTWGRVDRARRSHNMAGTSGIYELYAKDVKTAAHAAGERGVVLPIAGLLGAVMIEKAMARDAYVKAHGMDAPIPQCRICGQELAAPFRQAGLHPECAHDPEGQAAR